jgi:hypothetical protein
MNLLKITLLVTVLITLTSCGALSSSSGISKTTTEVYEPTQASSIEIFTSTKPTKPYIEIGIVSVLRVKSVVMPISKPAKKIMQEMKEKAASIGGDAIINYRESGETNMTGTIIKYK